MEKGPKKSKISNVIHHLQKAYRITFIYASTGQTNKTSDQFHLSIIREQFNLLVKHILNKRKEKIKWQDRGEIYDKVSIPTGLSFIKSGRVSQTQLVNILLLMSFITTTCFGPSLGHPQVVRIYYSR